MSETHSSCFHLAFDHGFAIETAMLADELVVASEPELENEPGPHAANDVVIACWSVATKTHETHDVPLRLWLKHTTPGRVFQWRVEDVVRAEERVLSHERLVACAMDEWHRRGLLSEDRRVAALCYSLARTRLYRIRGVDWARLVRAFSVEGRTSPLLQLALAYSCAARFAKHARHPKLHRR